MLGKYKLNSIAVLIAKALIDSYVSHDKSISVSNVLIEYPETSAECTIWKWLILWLNEKHIEERLDHNNLREITIKYHLDHRKHRCELTEQVNAIFIDEK